MNLVFCILPWMLLLIIAVRYLVNHHQEKLSRKELTYAPSGDVIIELDIPGFIGASESIFESFRNAVNGKTVSFSENINSPAMQLSVMVPSSSQKEFEKTYKIEEEWYGVLTAYASSKRKHSKLIITIFNNDEGRSFAEVIKFKGLISEYKRTDSVYTCTLGNKIGTEVYYMFNFSI